MTLIIALDHDILPVETNIPIVVLIQVLRTEWTASFGGLKGAPDCHK
jgi:hypothetical protein